MILYLIATGFGLGKLLEYYCGLDLSLEVFGHCTQGMLLSVCL